MILSATDKNDAPMNELGVDLVQAPTWNWIPHPCSIGERKAETMTEGTRRQIRDRYVALNTAIICDVFDELAIDPPVLDVSIGRRTFDRQRVAGWAYPIEGRLMPDKGADRLKLDVVDALPEGSVSVWGGTDAHGFGLFGDLIAATMQKRGCHGAVVDGGFRDVEDISKTGFPVFARYRSPAQSIGRWRVTKHGETITLPGALNRPVLVSSNDFILGDEDGVVVIPAQMVERVLERAEEIVATEMEARESSAKGMTAAEMLEKFGHV